MPWFKVDDTLAFHQKTLRAGNAAMGMWVRAGSLCAQQLTDGFITDGAIATLGGHALARRLVAAGLWLEVDNGYQFHQWSDDGRQPTRAAVEQERKDARLRKEQWRERKRNGNVPPSGTDLSQQDEQRDMSVRNGAVPEPIRARLPDPTRPVLNEQTKDSCSTESSEPDRFDEFWAVYPKHVAKQAAQRRWDILVKRGVDPSEIITGAKAYAAQVRGTEPQFVKQPDGWLHSGRWEDEHTASESRRSESPYLA